MSTNVGTEKSFIEKDNDLNAGARDNVSPISEPIENIVESSTEVLSDKLGAVKLKLSDNLSVAAEKVHQTSDVAQDFLFDKSDKVNTFAHSTIEKASHLGHRAADALDASSGYVREFDMAEKRDQVLGTIRERPEISLAIAGAFGLAIGLLVGRAMGSRR
jgi:ElaB/YqjD/DUF883 family membrane-anchored ribosome-binding protein